MAHDHRPNVQGPAASTGATGAPADLAGKRTLAESLFESSGATASPSVQRKAAEPATAEAAPPGLADGGSGLPRLDLAQRLPATPGISVQRRSDGAAAPSDPAQVTAIAETGLGSGGALPHQASLEAGFGVDLSDVRAHTGSSAAQASRAIGAEAYTMGSDIAFASASPSKDLVAHEVAHVIQQRSGAGPASGVGAAGDSFEVEADAAASTVAGGGTSDLAGRYSPAGAASSLQRKVVQRYESAEHAATADGMQYPIDIKPMALPNQAHATRGELVAFGDFYESYEAIARAPREETEALVGIIRWEGIWRLALRQKKNKPLGGGALTDADPKKQTDLHTVAEPDDTGVHGGEVAEAKGSTAKVLTWDDPSWDLELGGSTLRAKAQQIHAQFSPSWSFFSVNVPLTTFSENALTLQQMKLTLGRRRFRNTNNTLGSEAQEDAVDRNGAKTKPDTTNKKESDPGNLGGDYFDLASNNLSHFAIANWKTWEHYHQKVCDITKKDPSQKDRAVIEDAWGGHYLTDMFAAGHVVDKQDLMTEATSMVLGMSEDHGLSKKTDDKHEVIENVLTESLQLAFRDEAVYKAWQDGCRNAFDQGLVRYSEMELMLTIPKGTDWAHGKTVVGNLTKTIMGMPWRDKTDNNTPGGGAAESFGPGNKANGKGHYHLGVGNLAALTAHNALNKIGFMAENDAGDPPWRMQGDDHLTAATQKVAQKAVNESTRQAETGEYDPQKVFAITPRRGKIDPAWVKQYFDDRKGKGLVYDPTKMAELDGLIATAATTAVEFGDNPKMDKSSTVSKAMRDICIAIMKVEFSAKPEEFQELKDKVVEESGGDERNAPTGSMTNTGINISFLRNFLKENLPRMVPAAYASASAGDLSTEALEAYAPRDQDGNVLPTGANDFQWDDKKRVHFKVNVSGCKGGKVLLGVMVHDQDDGMDYLPSGQLEDEPVGRNEDEIFGDKGEVDSKDKKAVDAAKQTIAIIIPDTVAASANGRSYVDASFLLAGEMDHGEHYIRVFADAACTMPIGRSSPRDSGQTSNPSPAAPTHKATGPDASPPPSFYAASGVHGNAFEWDGSTVRFRLLDNSPPNPTATLRVWVKQFDRDSGYDFDESGREIPTEFFEPRDTDSMVSGPTQVDAARVKVEDKAISEMVTFAAVDNDNDTYVIVYADAECKRPLARSHVQGTNRGTVKDSRPMKTATGVNGFGWSGNQLSFRVDPPDTPKVWAKLFDKDNGFDYDTGGVLMSGSRNEDEQYGGIREVMVKDGKATLVASDADDSDTYAIIYANASCSMPLARSGVRG